MIRPYNLFFKKKVPLAMGESAEAVFIHSMGGRMNKNMYDNLNLYKVLSNRNNSPKINPRWERGTVSSRR
jgi:hypothetical protein